MTAGNSSGQNDAAAACIVTTPQRAAELGLTPMLRLVLVGGRRQRPAALRRRARCRRRTSRSQRAGIRFDDLDVIELNEAFAVQVLACLADWGVDAEDPRLNPRGSGISIGHPIGATGIRMLATLAHELPALDGDARARDDVHRRRPGARGGVRAGLSSPLRSVGDERSAVDDDVLAGDEAPAGDASQTTAPATSSTRPNRRSGVRSRRASAVDGSSVIGRAKSVSMTPGEMAFARTPDGPHCTARLRASCALAALVMP